MYRVHPDFPNYKIYETSKILNKHGKQIAHLPDEDGYLICFLWHNNKRRKFRVHRLVAELFCKRFSKDKQVHHMDNIRTNNDVNNLLCCTRQEHIEFTTSIRIKAKQEQVTAMFGEEMDDIQVWCSSTGELLHCASCLGDAVQFTGIDRKVVKEMLEKQLRWHLACDKFYFDRF